MQAKNLDALDKRTPDDRYAHRISRRDFIRLTAIASGGMGLWLSGCSSNKGQEAGSKDPLAVVEKWIRAANAEDVSAFEKLHTSAVFATSNFRREPYSGREHVWEPYKISTGRQIEKVIAFGQDQSVCLLVNATKFNRSLCYVFNFVDGLIDRVYEYASGQYDLSSSAHFSGIEIATDDSGLPDQLDTMEEMFVDGLNNRDFSTGPWVTESAMFFTPVSSEPIVGAERIAADGESYAKLFPSVSHKMIQAFGQGNVVCCHVMVEGAGKKSLCWVGVFHNGKIAEIYEFWSDAQVNGQL